MKRGRKKVDLLAAFKGQPQPTSKTTTAGGKGSSANENGFKSAVLRHRGNTGPSYSPIENSKTNTYSINDNTKRLAANRVMRQVENSIKEANSVARHFSKRSSKPITDTVSSSAAGLQAQPDA